MPSKNDPLNFDPDRDPAGEPTLDFAPADEAGFIPDVEVEPAEELNFETVESAGTADDLNFENLETAEPVEAATEAFQFDPGPVPQAASLEATQAWNFRPEPEADAFPAAAAEAVALPTAEPATPTDEAYPRQPAFETNVEPAALAPSTLTDRGSDEAFPKSPIDVVADKPSPAARSGKKSSRGLLIIAVSLVLLVVAGGAGGWWYLNQGDEAVARAPETQKPAPSDSSPAEPPVAEPAAPTPEPVPAAASAASAAALSPDMQEVQQLQGPALEAADPSDRSQSLGKVWFMFRNGSLTESDSKALRAWAAQQLPQAQKLRIRTVLRRIHDWDETFLNEVAAPGKGDPSASRGQLRASAMELAHSLVATQNLHVAVLGWLQVEPADATLPALLGPPGAMVEEGDKDRWDACATDVQDATLNLAARLRAARDLIDLSRKYASYDQAEKIAAWAESQAAGETNTLSPEQRAFLERQRIAIRQQRQDVQVYSELALLRQRVQSAEQASADAKAAAEKAASTQAPPLAWDREALQKQADSLQQQLIALKGPGVAEASLAPLAAEASRIATELAAEAPLTASGGAKIVLDLQRLSQQALQLQIAATAAAVPALPATPPAAAPSSPAPTAPDPGLARQVAEVQRTASAADEKADRLALDLQRETARVDGQLRNLRGEIGAAGSRTGSIPPAQIVALGAQAAQQALDTLRSYGYGPATGAAPAETVVPRIDPQRPEPNPALAREHATLAYGYYYGGNSSQLERAVEQFNLAAATDPTNPTYRYFAALALYRLGRVQAAESQARLARLVERRRPSLHVDAALQRVQGPHRVWLEQIRHGG